MSTASSPKPPAATTVALRPLTHGLRAMTGRDPSEPHRAATPLELLYDLVFVIALGVAGSEFAHALAEDHVGSGLLAFGFAMFAVVWAWISFVWFASAYDTDDWKYRLAVMVQMIGVVVLALGLPAMFESVIAGAPWDNTAMIAGYVIMRIPLVALWLRAARQDPARAESARVHATSIVVSQVLWCALLLVDRPIGTELFLAIPALLAEIGGPILAERRNGGDGTPWHPHHIAERYGLFTIITLGEILIGTVAALESVIGVQGWSMEVAVFAVAGVGLTFGLWWTYFNQPSGHILEARPGTAFTWGYGHLLLFTAITATGAGLHVIALFLEDHAELSSAAVMATTAIPVAMFLALSAGLYVALVPSYLRHTKILALMAAVVVASVVAAAAGLGLGWCVVILVGAPALSVVYHESGGGARREATVDELIDAS